MRTNPESGQTAIQQCDFCGKAVPQSDPFGIAYTYIHYPDETGGIDRDESQVKEVRICLNCAMSDTPPENTVPEISQEKLGRCDLCGHIGPNTGGNTGDGFILEDLMTWTVEIRGFKGHITVCRECTPIKTWDLFRRRGVDYLRDVSDVPTRSDVGKARSPSTSRDAHEDSSPNQTDLETW